MNAERLRRLGLTTEPTWKTLGPYQELFVDRLTDLFLFARQRGIPLRLKDALRAPEVFGKWGEKKGYGEAYSCHKVGLAVDLYTPDPFDYITLHDYWDTLGGASRIANDMNHFGFEFMGRW